MKSRKTFFSLFLLDDRRIRIRSSSGWRIRIREAVLDSSWFLKNPEWSRYQCYLQIRQIDADGFYLRTDTLLVKAETSQIYGTTTVSRILRKEFQLLERYR